MASHPRPAMRLAVQQNSLQEKDHPGPALLRIWLFSPVRTHKVKKKTFLASCSQTSRLPPTIEVLAIEGATKAAIRDGVCPPLGHRPPPLGHQG